MSVISYLRVSQQSEKLLEFPSYFVIVTYFQRKQRRQFLYFFT